MHSLLSKRDSRQLAFLELLMDNDSVPLHKISEKTQYPKRTLAEDIKQINGYLAPSHIVTGPEGIALNIAPGSSIREVYTMVLKQSREYQLMAWLFFNEEKTQEDIAEALYISVSTLRRMIGTMNQALKPRGIHIQTAPFRVMGDEEYITQFYTALFSELYYGGHGLIPPQQRNALTALCQKAFQNAQWSLNYPDLLQLLIWLYVRIIRTQNGHRKTLSREVAPALYTNITEDAQLQKNFFGAFHMHLNKELLFDLFQKYLRFGFARIFEDIYTFSRQSLAIQQLSNTIQTLLHTVANALNIPFTGTEELQRTLFNVLQFRNNPPYILYSKNKIFVHSFARYHPSIVSILQTVVHNVLFSQYGKDVVDETIYLLVTHWPDIVKQIEKTVSQVTVGIFFDSDQEHAQFIADMVRQSTQIDLYVSVLQLEIADTRELMCEGVDLLITNIPGMKSTCEQTICVQEYPSSHNWQSISLAIGSVFNTKLMGKPAPT